MKEQKLLARTELPHGGATREAFDEEAAANDLKEGSAGAGESLEVAAVDAKAWSLESTWHFSYPTSFAVTWR